jgi:hypothetical protein
MARDASSLWPTALAGAAFRPPRRSACESVMEAVVEIDSDSKKSPAAAGDNAANCDSSGHSSNTRFKPGRSGNPKGRPKGSENRKHVLTRIMGEMHEVVEHGKRRRRSTLDLLLISIRNRAVDGNVRAFKAYHDCLTKFAAQQPSQKVGHLVIPEGPATKEEFLKQVAEQQRALMEDVHWIDRLAESHDSKP